jgi:hypothetical protein
MLCVLCVTRCAHKSVIIPYTTPAARQYTKYVGARKINSGMIYETEKSPEIRKMLLMKHDVFWDVAPCGSYKNRRFGGT